VYESAKPSSWRAAGEEPWRIPSEREGYKVIVRNRSYDQRGKGGKEARELLAGGKSIDTRFKN